MDLSPRRGASCGWRFTRLRRVLARERKKFASERAGLRRAGLPGVHRADASPPKIRRSPVHLHEHERDRGRFSARVIRNNVPEPRKPGGPTSDSANCEQELGEEGARNPVGHGCGLVHRLTQRWSGRPAISRPFGGGRMLLAPSSVVP